MEPYTKMVLASVAVRKVWTDPGPVPAYHRDVKRAVKRRSPRLHRAIRRLVLIGTAEVDNVLIEWAASDREHLRAVWPLLHYALDDLADKKWEL